MVWAWQGARTLRRVPEVHSASLSVAPFSLLTMNSKLSTSSRFDSLPLILELTAYRFRRDGEVGFGPALPSWFFPASRLVLPANGPGYRVPSAPRQSHGRTGTRDPHRSRAGGPAPATAIHPPERGPQNTCSKARHCRRREGPSRYPDTTNPRVKNRKMAQRT